MDDTAMDALPYLTKNMALRCVGNQDIEANSYLMLLKKLNETLLRIEELEERMNRTQEYLRIGDYND